MMALLEQNANVQQNMKQVMTMAMSMTMMLTATMTMSVVVAMTMTDGVCVLCVCCGFFVCVLCFCDEAYICRYISRRARDAAIIVIHVCMYISKLRTYVRNEVVDIHNDADGHVDDDHDDHDYAVISSGRLNSAVESSNAYQNVSAQPVSVEALPFCCHHSSMRLRPVEWRTLSS